MDAIITRFLFFLPLFFIILQQVAQDSVAIQINEDVLRLHSMDHMAFQEEKKKNMDNARERIHEHVDQIGLHDHDHQKHSKLHQANGHDHDQKNPKEYEFFHLEDIHIGKTMIIYFRNGYLSLNDFLPKEKADKIPFSLKQLPKILHLFSIPQGSPEAENIKSTLEICNNDKPIKGEIKSCVTSLPSMLDFARRALGSSNIQYVSTKYLTGLTAEVQKFTVTKLPKQIPGNKLVVCHILTYPYRIRTCHSIENTRAYRIRLCSENGDEVDAIGICHFDTSLFSGTHMAFRVLGTKPGDGHPLCHFANADNVIFYSSN